MAKEGIEERRKYEIRKHNFRTGQQIEVYSKRIKGLSNAIRLVEQLDAQLIPEEKEAGISWYHHWRGVPQR